MEKLEVIMQIEKIINDLYEAKKQADTRELYKMFIDNAFIKIWYEIKKYEQNRLKINLSDIAKSCYEAKLEEAEFYKKFFKI